jgi:hypothetical protein
MLPIEGAGLMDALGAGPGDAPETEGALDPDPDVEMLGVASDLKDMPDCRISSRRIRISDWFRLRLNEMSQGISFCSNPLKWKYRTSLSN